MENHFKKMEELSKTSNPDSLLSTQIRRMQQIHERQIKKKRRQDESQKKINQPIIEDALKDFVIPFNDIQETQIPQASDFTLENHTLPDQINSNFSSSSDSASQSLPQQFTFDFNRIKKKTKNTKKQNGSESNDDASAALSALIHTDEFPQHSLESATTISNEDIPSALSKSIDKDSVSQDSSQLFSFDFNAIKNESKKTKNEAAPGSNTDVPPEISKLFHTDGQPQKPDKSCNMENSRKDKLTLSSLEHELISKLRLIRHEEGIYYFNGRTYVAIRNDAELLELFRSEIDDNAYGVSSTKIFQDLFHFLKTSKKLVPLNYEKRLKKSRNLVVLKNGVVDLTTCRLMNFNPEYLTFYELDANWTEKKPRYFEKFLQSASGEDEEIMTRTKEVMGYLLSGSNEGKVFFVIGTAPNSGKSTLAQFLKKVIDPQFIAATAPGNLGERFALGTNRSVILNIALDVPSGKLNSKAVSMLKSITGNDAITIEQKYMRPETIVSNTRFLFGTNYPIQISSDEGEDAFWDRMCIIPFEISVSESDKDPELLDHLIKEKDAIVSECLRAVQRIIYHKYQFSYCGAAEELKAKWRNDIDSHYTVNWFFRECVSITCNMNDYELTENVYDRYIQFCKDKGLTPERITQVKQWIDKNCSKNECYYTKIHTDGIQTRHVFRGLRLIC